MTTRERDCITGPAERVSLTINSTSIHFYRTGSNFTLSHIDFWPLCVSSRKLACHYVSNKYNSPQNNVMVD